MLSFGLGFNVGSIGLATVLVILLLLAVYFWRRRDEVPQSVTYTER